MVTGLVIARVQIREDTKCHRMEAEGPIHHKKIRTSWLNFEIKALYITAKHSLIMKPTINL